MPSCDGDGEPMQGCSSLNQLHGGLFARETREGWPLLTVETEANRDSMSAYERGPFLAGLLGSSCRYKRFLSCLGSSSRASTKFVFPRNTLFHSLVPMHRPASSASNRAASPIS
jgi:hypothetical protein